MFAVEKATYKSAMHRESNCEDTELNINTAFSRLPDFPNIYWPWWSFCKSVFVNEIDNECLSQTVMLALSTAASGTCWWGP